jgi:lauroyl/myristoyl acyltransferase
MAERFGLDGYFLRKLAMLGASKGPEWFLRYTPPVIGLAAMALVPSARRAVVRNLRMAHGERATALEAVDVARTFGATRHPWPRPSRQARRTKSTSRATAWTAKRTCTPRSRWAKAWVVASLHSGGWDVLGSLFADRVKPPFTIVMEPERDAGARRFHDELRERAGVKVAHAGDDPLAALPLLRDLKDKGIVALLCDRTPPGMKTFDVTLFDRPGKIPQGPFRLAQLSGAPVVPLFCARSGFRSYHVVVRPPIVVPRRATPEELDAAAQTVASAMTDFVRAYPTQWFHFASDG